LGAQQLLEGFCGDDLPLEDAAEVCRDAVGSLGE
jgi:hypothetical protein